MRNANSARRLGFTLIELLVVIAIIGLLVSLILVASADGVRRAEERATQSLITKLEGAVNDRYDALLNTQPPTNQTHRFLAAINVPQLFGKATVYWPVGTRIDSNGQVISANTSNSDDRRAQVIAQFDFIRAELPDVFFVNSLTSDGSTIAALYPLNFAATPYPAGTQNPTPANFVLPLGNNYPGLPLTTAGGLAITANPDGTPAIGVTGILGASFSAAGGIYKNLGYTPAGYDGIDNTVPPNGLIDEMEEGVPAGMTLGQFQAQVNAALARHTHKTARSEMLYALLVEGLSPLGSAFSREDFTAREVQDTDGDGLPEFVDAWGEPLQFFRWPIYYGGLPQFGGGQPNPVAYGTSDSQLGFRTYNGVSQAREQDPLDTNQVLISPAWWASAANKSTTYGQYAGNFGPPNPSYTPSTNFSSPGAIAFMDYFHSLVDPYGYELNSPPPPMNLWDRGSKFSRRAYFSKFLILSSGPDHEPGVAQFNKDYANLVDSSQTTLSSPYIYTFPTGTMEQSARALIYIENQAAVSDPLARQGSFYEIPDPDNTGKTATKYLNSTANSDDITNHNISGISTGVR